MIAIVRLLAIAWSVACCACAAPAMIEGVVFGEPFAMSADSPVATKTSAGRDLFVVVADVEAEKLRTVNVELREIESFPIGKPVQVGTSALEDRRPSLDVVMGPIVVETRDDGREIWTTDEPTKAVASDGWIRVEDVDRESVSGSFEVDLDDGGYLLGSFVALLR